MGWWFQSFSQKRHQNVCTALACRCIAIASPIEGLCMIHIIFNSPNSRPLLQNSWSVSCIHTNHHPKQCCPCCQKWDLQLMHCWEVLYAESTLVWTLASWQLKPSNEDTHSQVLVLLQRTQTWHHMSFFAKMACSWKAVKFFKNQVHSNTVFTKLTVFQLYVHLVKKSMWLQVWFRGRSTKTCKCTASVQGTVFASAYKDLANSASVEYATFDNKDITT